MKTFVIGHQKPDLDSVVSAIAIAHLHSKLNNTQFIPAITDPINPETQFVFNYFKQAPPKLINISQISKNDQIILVDHNEPPQRLPDLNQNQITHIYDHHKININLNKPIQVIVYPWGSTATIATHLFTQNDLTIDKDLAQLLLSAILSDTVALKSATTTEQDKKYAQSLAKIAQIKDLQELSHSIFKAKSDINQLTNKQIVTNDFKIFDFAQKTFIGQLETVQQADILKSRGDQLHQALVKVKKQKGVDLAFLAVTDILNTNTKLILASNKEASIAQKAFKTKTGNNYLDIGPILSRKKQIAPAIEKQLLQVKS